MQLLEICPAASVGPRHAPGEPTPVVLPGGCRQAVGKSLAGCLIEVEFTLDLARKRL